MSIATAIQTAQQRVASAYAKIQSKGGTIPAVQNLANMPNAIDSIPSGYADYITDGLVFQLDGINKGNNEGTWTDLISGTAYEKVGSPVELSDGWQFSEGNYFKANYSLNLVNSDRGSTLEFIYSGNPKDAFLFSGLSYAFGFEPDNNYYILTARGGRNVTIDSSLVPTSGVNSIALYNGYTSALYVNGVSKTFGSSAAYYVIGTTSSIGSRLMADSTYVASNAIIHAIRMYNRALSKFELDINHEIDKRRFNLPD